MSKDILNLSAKRQEINKSDKRKKQREQNDIRKLLKLVEGRRFFSRLWAESGLTNSSFVPGNDSQTIFNEGQRNIGLWALDEIMAVKPDAFAQILREFRSEALSQEEE